MEMLKINMEINDTDRQMLITLYSMKVFRDVILSDIHAYIHCVMMNPVVKSNVKRLSKVHTSGTVGIIIVKWRETCIMVIIGVCM